MTERDRFFECVFVSEQNEYQFHFRAPSDAAAERHFQETLRGYGITASGTVLIRDAKGVLLRTATFAPLEARDASP
jgi:hypothetical protein